MLHQQRSQIDAIAAHMASTAGLAVEQMSQCFEGSSSQAGTVAVQLAALRALLASVLCPASHRPLFLPQALALFTQVWTASMLLHCLCTLVSVAIACSICVHFCAVLPAPRICAVLACVQLLMAAESCLYASALACMISSLSSPSIPLLLEMLSQELLTVD